MGILYEIGLHILALFSFPIFLYQYLFKKKYRNSFLKRWGKSFPEIHSDKLIWLHAVSVGEIKAVSTFLKMLKEAYPEYQLLISSITETGHQEAKKCIPFADFHVYLPFDFSYVIGPILKRVKPKVVILSESDFWYNFLTISKKLGAKLFLINGKLSEKSAKRYRLFSCLKGFFTPFDLMCIQDETYQKRFLSLGLDPQKISVTGNLKLDDSYSQLSASEEEGLKDMLHIKQGDLVLVIGSTHDPEEELFLDLMPKLWERFPNLKVLLVPRHPERFKTVARLIERKQIPFYKFSEITSVKNGVRLILVDAMGQLRSLYQISDVSVVAGSFTPKVGGHNILEPNWFGKPSVYGPYMYTQKGFLDLARRYQSGLQTEEETLLEDLSRLLQNPEERYRLGSNGKRLFESAKGASKRSLDAISKFL